MDSTGKYRDRARPADKLLVRALRASDAAHRELTWFFGPALSDIEAPSNYGLMVQRATYDSGRGGRSARVSDDGVEHRADALHAARIICERLRGVPREQVAVLQTLYTPAAWPPAVEEVCGWLTPLVCGLSWTTAVAALEQAHGIAARALSAYEAARGSGPSVAPTDEGGN